MSITGLEYFVSRRLSTDTTPGQKVSERTLEIDTDLIHPWVGLGWVGLICWQLSWVGFSDTVTGWVQRLRALTFSESEMEDSAFFFTKNIKVITEI